MYRLFVNLFIYSPPFIYDSFTQIYIFFPEEPKVGIKTLDTYKKRMKSENVFRAILVVQQNLTPFARTSIGEISSKVHLEVFQVKVKSVNSFWSLLMSDRIQ